MDPKSIARARLQPRWRDAWAQPRYFYQSGPVQLPFSVEQSTAIRSGATHLKLGDTDATFTPGTVTIDGNTFDLLRGNVAPQDIIISAGHVSAHLDIDAVLTELWLVTNIEPSRWCIVLLKDGHVDITIAPSAAFVADEIRRRPPTDHVSLGQWLERYDVQASPDKLAEVFGPAARLLPPGSGTGSDGTVLDAFVAPVTVYLHGAAGSRTRRLNATGTMSIKDVLKAAPRGKWFLHGAPLLPFADCCVWRCCVHGNEVLHLYSQPHPGAYEMQETLAGVVRLPTTAAHRTRPYVPYPTPSGNMFGNAVLPRAHEVAAAAPHLLMPAWLALVNAGERIVSFDHAVVMVAALSPRYGRAQCIEIIGRMMVPGQHAILVERLAAAARPQVAVRNSYGRWLQCFCDHLYGTRKATPVMITLADRQFPLACSFMWSEIVGLIPSGYTPAIAGNMSDAMRAAMARPDFMLEELRTDTVALVLTQRPRKRKRP